MQIQKNFLDPRVFTELVDHFNDTRFPWYYPESARVPEGEPCQYINLLYYDNQFFMDVSPTLMRCLRILTDQLNAVALLKIKVNATPSNAPEQVWHTDWQISTPSKTCVLYLYDNDGYTEFETGEKVVSQANTAVIFDTNLKHRGVSATNVDRRLVLNVSYFEA